MLADLGAEPEHVLADALRRMLARLGAGGVGGVEAAAPEVLELERRATIAMTPCTCGHIWHLHEHVHIRTCCDACDCQRFRPAAPPPPLVPAPQPRAADDVLIKLRVAVWTRSWRDRGGTQRPG